MIKRNVVSLVSAISSLFLDHLDLIAVRILDEKEPCQIATVVLEIHQLARR
jgi:hypothetical protein